MKLKGAVREFLAEALADPTHGFNAVFPTNATGYGLAEFLLFDFVEGSRNVMFSQIGNTEDLAVTRLFGSPALLTIYTSIAQHTAIEKGRQFSGLVVGHLDFYISKRLSEGSFEAMEGMDTESLGDAIEETVYQVFRRQGLAPSSGADLMIGQIQSTRNPVKLFDNGWEQQIQFQLGFEVHA